MAVLPHTNKMADTGAQLRHNMYTAKNSTGCREEVEDRGRRAQQATTPWLLKERASSCQAAPPAVSSTHPRSRHAAAILGND